MKLLKTSLLLGSLFITFSCATHTKCDKAQKECKSGQCSLDKSKCNKDGKKKDCKGKQCKLKKKKEEKKS